jgi:oxygen-independent coproporphyrinogen-3 oxidase
MSALPGQRTESWEQTLKRVTLLHPEHISAYSLIIEEGTPFYERYHAEEEKRNQGLHTELLPDEEEERSMYEMTQEILAARGYERYEISNYARRGYECRHNQGYWMRKNYLGLGLGSSSLIENVRFQNTSNLKDYMEHSFEHSEKMILDRFAQMEEFMFLGLRLSKGISRHDFETEFSIAIEGVYGDVLKRLKEQKLLEAKEGRIYLTERGIDVSNLVLSEFLLSE